MKQIFLVSTQIMCIHIFVLAQSSIPEINMVFVKGGTFTMGCTPEQGVDCDKTAKPTHQVTVNDFYIGKYEVTQSQWKEVMGNNPSKFEGKFKPVENVNWDDVQKFIRKLNQRTGLNYRLPTDAEWEYAARGGTLSKGYKYSGSNDIKEVAWCGHNSNDVTHDVGTKKANELGIHDMCGNIYEWINDWYSVYSSEPQSNPKGPETGTDHILRGGSWSNNNAIYLTIVHRFWTEHSDRTKFFGFRLALSKL